MLWQVQQATRQNAEWHSSNHIKRYDRAKQHSKEVDIVSGQSNIWRNLARALLCGLRNFLGSQSPYPKKAALLGGGCECLGVP